MSEPSSDDLQHVREWPLDHGPLSWFKFIRSIWNEPAWGWTEEDAVDEMQPEAKRTRSIFMSTGGWSGNESVIEAMRENTVLWVLTWVSSRRGGHYEFEVKL